MPEGSKRTSNQNTQIILKFFIGLHLAALPSNSLHPCTTPFADNRAGKYLFPAQILYTCTEKLNVGTRGSNSVIFSGI